MKIMCSACGRIFEIPNNKIDLILNITGICEKTSRPMCYLVINEDE